MLLNELALKEMISDIIRKEEEKMGAVAQSPMDELLMQIKQNHPHIKGLQPDMKLGNPEMPYDQSSPFSLENYDLFVEDIIDVGSRRSGLDSNECRRRILGNEYSPEYTKGEGKSYVPTLQNLLDRCFM